MHANCIYIHKREYVSNIDEIMIIKKNLCLVWWFANNSKISSRADSLRIAERSSRSEA